MKRFIASIVAASFLAVVSAPLFAAETAPASTPAAKVLKHKRHHKKAMSKKKAMTSATPTAK